MLDIVALGNEDTIPKPFLFSSVTTAAVQETGPIKSMIENEIHHLRPKHLRLMVSVLLLNPQATVPCRYLLLLSLNSIEGMSPKA